MMEFKCVWWRTSEAAQVLASEADSACVSRATARTTPPCCAASCWALAWTLMSAWALTPRGRRTPGSWPVAVMEPSPSGRVWQLKGWLWCRFGLLWIHRQRWSHALFFCNNTDCCLFPQVPAQSHRPRRSAPGPPAQSLLPLQDGGLRLQPPELPGQLSAVGCCERVHLWLPGSVVFNALVFKSVYQMSHCWHGSTKHVCLTGRFVVWFTWI